MTSAVASAEAYRFPLSGLLALATAGFIILTEALPAGLLPRSAPTCWSRRRSPGVNALGGIGIVGVLIDRRLRELTLVSTVSASHWESGTRFLPRSTWRSVSGALPLAERYAFPNRDRHGRR